MKGYDEYNTILLPPRAPGDRLPQELLDYYDGEFFVGESPRRFRASRFMMLCLPEQMRKLEEAERLRREAEEAAEAARREQEEREGESQ